MQSRVHPPLWGEFIAHADEDLLAFGLLIRGELHTLAFYHGVQAIEKYLKTPLTQQWLRTHDLEKLANKCKDAFPFYGESGVLDNLKRFTEFDQATRYPWVERGLGNGFCSDDISIIGDLCKQLRCDLPITRDDYKLGMEVRGYFHGDRSRRDQSWEHYSHEAVAALRSVLPSLNEFVRGWDNSMPGQA